MGHNSGFLSGPEPEEIEQKTTAELNDAKRPAGMSVSSSMFDLAETDDRPAIEQRAAKGVIFTDRNNTETKSAAAQTGGVKFKIDEDFAKEMHAREAAEKQAHERQRKAAAAAAATIRAQREAAARAELTGTRTLDPEEEQTKLKLQQQVANEQKLYPDPIKHYTDADDEVLKRDLKKGKLPERARIVEKFDEKLHKTIMITLACDAAAAVLYLMYYATQFNHNFPGIMRTAALVTAIGFLAYSSVTLYMAGKRCHNHTIPYDQRGMFKLAMIGPGFFFRIGIGAALSIVLGLFGNIGSLIATFSGLLLGAGAYYSIIANFNVPFGEELALINAAIFSIINTVIPILATQIAQPSSSFSELPALAMQIGGMLVSIAIIFVCEHFAMKIFRPPKESI